MSKRLPDDGAGWCKEEAEPTIDELPPPTFKDHHLHLHWIIYDSYYKDDCDEQHLADMITFKE